MPDASPDQDTLCWPDYQGGSLVNLSVSLAQAMGAEIAGTPLHPGLLGPLATEGRDIALLLVDGLGDAQLARHGPASFLRAHQRTTLSSVFPSTTASALTSVQTATPPSQHGLTGWEMYSPAHRAIVHPLTLGCRHSEAAAPTHGALATALYQTPSWFDRLARPAVCVLPQHLVPTPFSRHHAGRTMRVPYRDWPALFAALEQALASRTPTFVYAYTSRLDHEMHAAGPDDWSVSRSFTELDERIEAFCQTPRRRPLTLLVTADHGFAATPRDKRVAWETLPEALQALLARPLSGEGRVRFCHVKQGGAAHFAALAEEILGEVAWVKTSASLVERGAFGPPPYQPELMARVGDVTLLMKEGHTLRDTLPGERWLHLDGSHGGVSRAEMRVPLIRVDIDA